MAKVKAVPDGFHSVTPYLFIKGAAKAIDFYKDVFGAGVLVRMEGPGGSIAHAEIRIGDSVIMLGDEVPQMGALSPLTVGGASSGLNLYLENVDAVVEKAVGAGAKIVRPLKDQFYGDRSATLLDPFGHMWTLATHIEDVSPDEMKKRMAAAMSQGAGA